MKQMIDRAMFWRFIPQVENPIKLVKVRGSSTREKKPIISPIEHVNALISALDEPYDLMVLVAATLGPRIRGRRPTVERLRFRAEEGNHPPCLHSQHPGQAEVEGLGGGNADRGLTAGPTP
jgi:hypothetical protein